MSSAVLGTVDNQADLENSRNDTKTNIMSQIPLTPPKTAPEARGGPNIANKVAMNQT